MKKTFIAVVLLLGALAAHADTIAYLADEAGGRINLTDNRVNCPAGSKYGFTTGSNTNNVLESCWSLIGDKVRITFHSEGRGTQVRMFDVTHWSFTPYGIANGRRAATNAGTAATSASGSRERARVGVALPS